MSNSNNPVKLFSELLGGPLGELISSIGKGVGEAQAALDEGALRQTLELYNSEKDSERSEEEMKLLNLIRSMGYQPTFYTIPETEVEAQISLSMDLNSEQTGIVGKHPLSKYSVNAIPVNAGNVNRYNLQSNAMAKLKFKIVPVPPPSSVPEIRIVPDLMHQKWNDVKAILLSLGFEVQFQNQLGEILSEETLEEKTITAQSIPGGTISTVNTILTLTFTD